MTEFTPCNLWKSGVHMALVFMTVNHQNGQVQTMEMTPNKVLPKCTRSEKQWAEQRILMSDHNSVWWSLVGQGSKKVEVEHQVLQILSNPSKRKFWKWQHFPLATYEKVVYTWYLFSWLSTTKMTKCKQWKLSLIHIWRCRRLLTCRSRWSPYH